MQAQVRSVNVGPVRSVQWGRTRRSAIDKRPVDGPVGVSRLGLAGDEIADLVHHGGVDQAVYAYAREDLDVWAGELGRELPDGRFGENLTTQGIDVTGACLGDRWRVGSALVEVCDVRTPCRKFQAFLGEPRWERRFTERGAPGAYLRVIEDGVVQTGDEIVVTERRGHDLTVGLAFRALTTERDLIRRFGDEPRASAAIARRVEAQRVDAERNDPAR